jgi:hypothetical protein
LPPTFDLFPLRFHFIAATPIQFPDRMAANLVRGSLGKTWMRIAPQAYARWFSPESTTGPSGLRDSPRPFVFRASHLDDVNLPAGAPFHFGINLFETREPIYDLFAKAFEERFGPIQSIEGTEILRLPIEPVSQAVRRARVRFVTPTELKGVGHTDSRPEFGALFARIRDRVSTLRALYGSGPLNIDFRMAAERANCVKMIKCEIERVDAAERMTRLSRRTGQAHSLGGFIGEVEYEGDLAEFIPYLEIARWTGVGRQTVWGKGEIAWEMF